LGKEQIARENPIVKADKLVEKIWKKGKKKYAWKKLGRFSYCMIWFQSVCAAVHGGSVVMAMVDDGSYQRWLPRRKWGWFWLLFMLVYVCTQEKKLNENLA
jgi:hypothetical protein